MVKAIDNSLYLNPNKCPPYLYRYRSALPNDLSVAERLLSNAVMSDCYEDLNSDEKPWFELRSLLLEHKVYFACPNSFNDPFEFLPLNKSFKDRLSNKQEQVIKGSRLNPEKKFDALKRMRRSDRAKKAKQEAERTWASKKDFVKDIGVLCLAEFSDDIRMWSHYAKDHKGYSVIFNLQPIKEMCHPTKHHPLVSSAKVNYTEDRPYVDFGEMTAMSEKGVEFAFQLGYTKAPDWKYEQEWRCWKVCFTDADRVVVLPKDCVAGIILGCKMPEEQKAFLKKKIPQLNEKLKVFSAELSPDKYAIEIPGLRDALQTMLHSPI